MNASWSFEYFNTYTLEQCIDTEVDMFAQGKEYKKLHSPKHWVKAQLYKHFRDTDDSVFQHNHSHTRFLIILLSSHVFSCVKPSAGKSAASWVKERKVENATAANCSTYLVIIIIIIFVIHTSAVAARLAFFGALCTVQALKIIKNHQSVSCVRTLEMNTSYITRRVSVVLIVPQ